jgi:hypothetical protein
VVDSSSTNAPACVDGVAAALRAPRLLIVFFSGMADLPSADSRLQESRPLAKSRNPAARRTPSVESARATCRDYAKFPPAETAQPFQDRKRRWCDPC